MEKLFKKLNKIIDKYDNFILMGHRDPDLDALGSSLGLCEIIEKRKKDAYLFLDISHLEEYNTNINVAFDKMEKDIRCINEKTYKKYITENTLLIVTDVHIKERLEYPEILDEVDTVVLDHHIKSKNYIKDTIYTYIDSNLSSMSELITMYALYNKVDLDNVIASILLGGIEIDTNEYNFKTSAQTYEAAKTLMDMGADVILKQELLKKLKDTKHSLMVYMCYKDEKIPYEEIVELMKQINEHFGKTTIDIAIVEHNQELKANELNIENISENVYKIEVFNLLEDGAIGNYDACKPFLSKIKLKKSFKDYLFKVSKGRKRMRVYLFGIKILSFQYHN